MSSSKTSYPNTKREYQYCDTCGSLLPAPGFFAFNVIRQSLRNLIRKRA